MALIDDNLRLIERPPTWFGAVLRSYNNFLDSSTDVIAADYFEGSAQPLAARDLIWCHLNDGWFTLRMTSPTTAEIATD